MDYITLEQEANCCLVFTEIEKTFLPNRPAVLTISLLTMFFQHPRDYLKNSDTNWGNIIEMTTKTDLAEFIFHFSCKMFLSFPIS